MLLFSKLGWTLGLCIFVKLEENCLLFCRTSGFHYACTQLKLGHVHTGVKIDYDTVDFVADTGKSKFCRQCVRGLRRPLTLGCFLLSFCLKCVEKPLA